MSDVTSNRRGGRRARLVKRAAVLVGAFRAGAGPIWLHRGCTPAPPACPSESLERMPPEILARTPYQTADELHRFLKRAIDSPRPQCERRLALAKDCVRGTPNRPAGKVLVTFDPAFGGNKVGASRFELYKAIPSSLDNAAVRLCVSAISTLPPWRPKCRPLSPFSTAERAPMHCQRSSESEGGPRYAGPWRRPRPHISARRPLPPLDGIIALDRGGRDVERRERPAAAHASNADPGGHDERCGWRRADGMPALMFVVVSAGQATVRH
jgi:hypothetical protein